MMETSKKNLYLNFYMTNLKSILNLELVLMKKEEPGTNLGVYLILKLRLQKVSIVTKTN